MDLKTIFMNYNVVLASSSSSRRNVLNLMGISSFYWFSPSIDEDKFMTNDPMTCSMNIARAKMDACLASLKSEETPFYRNEPLNYRYFDNQSYHEYKSMLRNPEGSDYKQPDIEIDSALNNNLIDTLEQKKKATCDSRFRGINPDLFSDISYLDIDLINQRYKNVKTEPPMKECFLVCSDQVVYYNNQIRQKPKDLQEARQNLMEYSSYDLPIITYSAVVVTNTITRKYFCGVEISKVWFDKIPNDDIEEILASGKTLFSAGGFLIDDKIMGKYIYKIEGSKDAILGLPTQLLESLLNNIAEDENGWKSKQMKLLEKSS